MSWLIRSHGPRSAFDFGRPFPRPPSHDFFGMLKEWINACGKLTEHETEHGRCLPHAAGPFELPTRVLKISKHQDEFKLRLHEGRGLKERYTALSHCWGNHQPLMTTKENISRHLSCIEWSELPRMFQDAVIITHGLDIEYLWIDSLCIMQNDKEDWTREAAQMKNIYPRSHVTIAAASGTDSQHDLFPRTENASIIEENYKDHCSRHAIFDSALCTRAWVLQERLLSARILYFYGDEVVLECLSTIRCQCGGSNLLGSQPPGYWQVWAETWGNNLLVGHDETLYYRFNDAVGQMQRRSIMQQLQAKHPEESITPRLSLREAQAMMFLWDEVLGHYCRRQITKLADRLPAISGIAYTFGSFGFFGDYVAGIWDAYPGQLLTWYIEADESSGLEPPSDDDSSMAPSWSWASVRGAWGYKRLMCPYPPVAFQTFFSVKFFEIDFGTENPDSFGAVKSGTLEVEGYLITATIEYSLSDEKARYSERFKVQKVKLVKNDLRGKMWADFVLDAVSQPLTHGEDVHCLAIAGDSGVEQPFVQGLVLRHREQNTYERMGVFQCPFDWFEACEPSELKIV
jgi:Heterokaryon incompatibility protein (HET)